LLSNHLTYAPVPPVKENLLFKYKAMSDLQPEELKQFTNYEIDRELLYKATQHVYNSDKKLFEAPYLHEVDRVTAREQVNTKVLKLIEEWKKIVPFKDLCNDLRLWMAIVVMPHAHDMSISTKFVVNLQLYHKSLVNIGTEQH
jgi:hypothetical protein